MQKSKKQHLQDIENNEQISLRDLIINFNKKYINFKISHFEGNPIYIQICSSLVENLLRNF